MSAGDALEPAANRQAPPVIEERGIVALDQFLRAMSNPFTVMCVAARADDVDYGTLAYYRKKIGARTVIVLATRGEGGESAVGPETGKELGIVRTREALEAAKIAGADVYFLNLRDFGHAKTAEEVLSAWGKEEALARLVRAIRLLRPDVIITNHLQEAGNGYQQAVGKLLLEAFEAAADVKRFTEAGSEAWQVRRIFQSAVETGEVAIDLTEYDYLRGRTYAQIGLAAYQRLASFGPWPLRPSSEMGDRSFILVRSAREEILSLKYSFLEGLSMPDNVRRSVTPPIVGDMLILEALTAREKLIQALTDKLIEKRLEGTAKDLHNRYGAEFFRVLLFTEALERALAVALGLSFEIIISDPVVVPGQKVTARLVLRNHSGQTLAAVFHAPQALPVTQAKPSYKTSEVLPIPPGASLSQAFEYEVPANAALTLPHSARLYEETFYPLGSALPDAQAYQRFGHEYVAIAEVNLGQTTLPLPALARFDVAAPVEMATIPFIIVKDWDTPRDIEFPVRLRNRMPGSFAGALWVVPLALSQEAYEPARIAFTQEDDEIQIKLKLKAPIFKPPLSPDILLEFRREKPAPPDPLASAKVAVKTIDFTVPEGLTVGYISGFDASLGLALTQLGVNHRELRLEELGVSTHGNNVPQQTETQRDCSNLAGYDTIIIDSRAYTAHPELARHARCLLRYAQQGGNLVVLYQQPANDLLMGFQPDYAPFPIKLSDLRITQETAPVK
ncbi:MAG TPA: PIG-L family deacetylase, partial [Blastocatellia bacterium]|nr:PIG-L family deacetylase [Blastocatellia bacterium]